jgi:PRC-barrel domain
MKHSQNKPASQVRVAPPIRSNKGVSEVARGLTMMSLAILLLLAADTVQSPAPAFAAVIIVAEAGRPAESKPKTAEERMRARFPQPVRVGDLVGLPLLDDAHSTLGHVREVVRTKDDKIKLIIAYGSFLGWGGRPVAVPIEVVGIRGRELASLDMPRGEYAIAPTWQQADATILLPNAFVLVALCRGY